jgi:2'-hydroxyisoflavone reductase
MTPTLPLRILVLGGTAWLGREIARTAVDHGHEVTCVARGESGDVTPGVAFVRADRDQDDALTTLASQHWDAVIDVARRPDHVRRAVRDLAGAQHYVFVSTCNVYRDQNVLDADEDEPLLDPLDGDDMEVPDSYGRGKVACELAVLNGFGADRSFIVRSGLIAGPGDITGRTGYWPVRFAHPAAADGTVLVPDDTQLLTQVADVRDLSEWIVGAVEERTIGIVNAMGDSVSLGDHLAAARVAAGHTGPVAAASTDWLTQHGVQEFAGPKSLPLWLSDPDWRGFMARSNARAKATGLTLRPLADTLADVLNWELDAGLDRERGAGLTRDEERELLTELSGRE